MATTVATAVAVVDDDDDAVATDAVFVDDDGCY